MQPYEYENENEYTPAPQPASPEPPVPPVPEWGDYTAGSAYGAEPAPRSPYADSPYVMNHSAPPVRTPPAKPARAKKSGAGRVILSIVLALGIAVTSSAITATVLHRSYSRKLEDTLNQRLATMQNQVDSFVSAGTANNGTGGVENSSFAPSEGLTPGQIYAQNVRAVVAVTCVVRQSGGYYGQSGTYESSGSGFIVSADGYVVSNAHVVEGATEVYIHTVDGQEIPAVVVGSDATNDVALLKMEGKNYPTVTVGSSDTAAVGDQVVAIGNPLGELTSTLTVGYVSAKDRVVTTDGSTINMLQTDAAINSGNSGGPLFNAFGEVIGITSAKYSGTSTSGATIEGIGFAIPIDDVKGILSDLSEFGYVKSAYLGVYCREVSADAVRDGLPAGVYIEEVTPGYCAEAAGIQRGDIITGLGDTAITGMTDLTRALRKAEPGVATTVTVYRSGQTLTLTITLNEKPQEESQQTQPPAQEETPSNGGYPDFFEDYFGFGDFFG